MIRNSFGSKNHQLSAACPRLPPEWIPLSLDQCAITDYTSQMTNRIDRATQVRLAAHAGVDPNTIYLWLVGRRSPRPATLTAVRLAAAELGVTLPEPSATRAKQTVGPEELIRQRARHAAYVKAWRKRRGKPAARPPSTPESRARHAAYVRDRRLRKVEAMTPAELIVYRARHAAYVRQWRRQRASNTN